MTTSQFVEHLLRSSGGSVSRSEMLQLINMAQNEILSNDTNLTRVKPDPDLATTDGVYSYELAQNIRSVRRVYVNLGYTTSYDGELMSSWKGGYNRKDGSYVREVPVMTKDSSSPNAASGSRATVIWPSDRNPGDSTTTYKLEQYTWPEQLSSENIAMTIPDQFLMTLVKSRVMLELVESQYGNDVYWSADRKYKSQLKDFLRWASNSEVLDYDAITYREI